MLRKKHSTTNSKNDSKKKEQQSFSERIENRNQKIVTNLQNLITLLQEKLKTSKVSNSDSKQTLLALKKTIAEVLSNVSISSLRTLIENEELVQEIVQDKFKMLEQLNSQIKSNKEIISANLTKIEDSAEKIRKIKQKVNNLEQVLSNLESESTDLSNLNVKDLTPSMDWTPTTSHRWKEIEEEGKRNTQTYSWGWLTEKVSSYIGETTGHKNKVQLIEEIKEKKKLLLLEADNHEEKLKTLALQNKELESLNSNCLINIEMTDKNFTMLLDTVKKQHISHEEKLLKLKAKKSELKNIVSEIDQQIERLQQEEEYAESLNQKTTLTKNLLTTKPTLPISTFVWDISQDFSQQDKIFQKVLQDADKFKKESTAFESKAEKLFSEMQLLRDSINETYKEQAIPVVLKRLFQDLKTLMNSLRKEREAQLAALKKQTEIIEKNTELRNQHKEELDYQNKIKDYLGKINKSKIDEIIKSFKDIHGELRIDAQALTTLHETFAHIVKKKQEQANSVLSSTQRKVIAECLESFLEKLISSINPSGSVQADIISILNHLTTLNITLQSSVLKKLATLLEVKFKLTLDDLFICVNAKMDITALIKSYFPSTTSIQRLHEDDLVTLLKICETQGISSSKEEGRVSQAFYQDLQERWDFIHTQKFIKSLNKINTIAALLSDFAIYMNGLRTPTHFDLLQAIEFTFKKMQALKLGQDKNSKVDTKDFIAFFANFLTQYVPKITDLSIQHDSLIQILHHFDGLRLILDSEIAGNIGKLLNFSNVANINTEQACEQILICARTGINIQGIVATLCDSTKFVNSLNKDSLATLLFACSIHDANAMTSKGKINRELITILFKKIEMDYSAIVKKNSSQELIALNITKMMYTTTKERFANNSVKEVKFFRFILQAAAFYQFDFGQNINSYLNDFIDLNDENTISELQELLFNYLSAKLKGANVTVVQEKKINVGGFSVDILIIDNDTKKRIDVEYDGYHHFYVTSNFSTSSIYMREDNARDQAIEKNGVKVIRFTARDFGPTKFTEFWDSPKSYGLEKIYTSTQLKSFIQGIISPRRSNSTAKDRQEKSAPSQRQTTSKPVVSQEKAKSSEKQFRPKVVSSEKQFKPKVVTGTPIPSNGSLDVSKKTEGDSPKVQVSASKTLPVNKTTKQDLFVGSIKIEKREKTEKVITINQQSVPEILADDLSTKKMTDSSALQVDDLRGNPGDCPDFTNETSGNVPPMTSKPLTTQSQVFIPTSSAVQYGNNGFVNYLQPQPVHGYTQPVYAFPPPYFVQWSTPTGYQQSYPQNGYQQPIHQQTDYPHPMYPQSYPQNGYQQPTHQQTGYPQPMYHPQSYPQNGYQQPVFYPVNPNVTQLSPPKDPEYIPTTMPTQMPTFPTQNHFVGPMPVQGFRGMSQTPPQSFYGSNSPSLMFNNSVSSPEKKATNGTQEGFVPNPLNRPKTPPFG